MASLKILNLNLQGNSLGTGENALKFLVEGLKTMKNLKSLNLNLSRNELGKKVENMKHLGYAFKVTNKELESLTLHL